MFIHASSTPYDTSFGHLDLGVIVHCGYGYGQGQLQKYRMLITQFVGYFFGVFKSVISWVRSAVSNDNPVVVLQYI